MYRKYAQLLTEYCLEVKEGSRVMIQATYLAEPLLIELCQTIAEAGGIPILDVTIANQDKVIINNSTDKALSWVNPLDITWASEFEGYLRIKSDFPFNSTTIDPTKMNIYQNSRKEFKDIYNERTGNRSLKRSLCIFPTPQLAQLADMPMDEYEKFIFNGCKLYEDNPSEKWREFGRNQQKVVDYLNKRTKFRYVGPNIDMSFTTQGRLWINSDGKTNMPSGEIYTSPVDNSMNGWVKFTIPSIMEDVHIEGVKLEAKNGVVTHWSAEKGQEKLDEVIRRPGANKFGEAAIGTNYNITRPINNILFDEKIGGTIHMALGQAYKQCNGTNESSVHWDLITDMSQGEIYADDELCYQNGKFIVS